MTENYETDPTAVCASCAVVIANADTSHLSESEAARITAESERIGMMVLTGETVSGAFTCELCGQDGFDDGQEVEELIPNP